MESKLTPSLRFREYKHEWKAKTFKELGSVAMCKRIFKEQTTAQGEIPFYKIGTFGKVADSYISRETYEEYKGKYIYPKVGDILLSASGTIGRTVIYDGEDAYFQDSNIIWFNAHKESLDNSFLYQFYQVVKWNGFEGSTIKRLYNENVLSTSINLPSLDEQTKIGSFFKNLDDTISLHQQELEALKQTKQGFLQKMFPKEGEVIPSLRLKGYLEKWTTVKLDEKVNIFNNLRIPVTSSNRVKGKTPYYGANGVQDYVEGYTHNGEFVLIAEDGANDLINYPVQYVTGKIWVNNHAHVVSGKSQKLDTLFLKHRINSMNVSKYLVGGGRSKLNLEALKKLLIVIPSFEEQVKIGEFFRQLDEVIELKEKEIEALKETKKGFLQKMFV